MVLLRRLPALLLLLQERASVLPAQTWHSCIPSSHRYFFFLKAHHLTLFPQHLTLTALQLHRRGARKSLDRKEIALAVSQSMNVECVGQVLMR